jgi:ribosomal protein S8
MVREKGQLGHSNFGVGQILSSLKRGIYSYRKSVFVVRTKLSGLILSFFYKKGLIESYNVFGPSKYIVTFRHWRGEGLVKQLRIISVPTRRVFCDSYQLQRRYKSRNIVVVSTSQGLMTSVECIFRGIGGEVLFEIII